MISFPARTNAARDEGPNFRSGRQTPSGKAFFDATRSPAFPVGAGKVIFGPASRLYNLASRFRPASRIPPNSIPEVIPR